MSAVDRHITRGRVVQAEDQPHRGGLPGTVGAEESGHDTWPDGEVDLVDRQLLSVALSQSLGFDHVIFLAVQSPQGHMKKANLRRLAVLSAITSEGGRARL